MLDPPLFRQVLRHLSPTTIPTLDAFASASTAQLARFWTISDDALSQDWLAHGLLWANPPFSLLPAVLAKIQREGGHLILLCPLWSPARRGLWALAHDSWVLPETPLFRVRGADLLPHPAWRTVALAIRQPRPPA